MESEKAKEIKKALEERTQHKPINCCNAEYVEACGMYCRHHREFVADMGSKNGQTCKNCDNFIATAAVKEYADILTLINELESENKELRVVTDIANERTYRKKFTDEWRKEYQKELDKQGNGHIAGFPDFDLVYKLYFEQKDRIAELEKENRQLSKAINNVQKGFDNGEFISKDCKIRTLKQFVERAKERCHNYYPSIDHYCCSEKAVSVKDIDELLKEYEK